MYFRSGDSEAVDQRTGFKVKHSDLRKEPVTGLLVVDPDPEHPSLDMPPPMRGVETVDEPTGPQQDIFIQHYGVVVGVNG